MVKQNTQSNDAKHKHTGNFKREPIVNLNQIVLNRTHNQIVLNTVKEAAYIRSLGTAHIVNPARKQKCALGTIKYKRD